MGAATGAKKKKKEEDTNGANVGNGYQTIVIKQPIELITKTPTATRVDPITNKNIGPDGKLV